MGTVRFHYATLLLTDNVLKFNYSLGCFPPVDFKIGPLIIYNVLFCLNKIKRKFVAPT